MPGRLRTAVVATALCLAAVGGFTLMSSAPAAADTGSCVGYLESNGADTTLRVQVCALTEAVGDAVSQEAALQFCGLAMGLTLMPPAQIATACKLAVAPS